MTTIKIHSVRPTLRPRGSLAGAWAAKLWDAVEVLAARWSERNAARRNDADQVRAMAHRLRDSNPSFANDLLVAAALHEARQG